MHTYTVSVQPVCVSDSLRYFFISNGINETVEFILAWGEKNI